MEGVGWKGLDGRGWGDKLLSDREDRGEVLQQARLDLRLDLLRVAVQNSTGEHSG
jgi:hypothetical protein